MKYLTKYLNYPLATIFSLCILFAVYGIISHKESVPVSWLIVPSGAVLCLFIAVKLNQLESIDMDISKYRRITALMSIILFTVQLISAVLSDFVPKNDLLYVCTGAKNLILGLDISTNLPDYQPDYFEIYPNNHMLFMVIYLLYRIEFALTGNMSNFLPIAVNIISLNLSYILMCRCAEIVHKPSRALVCAVRGILFTPFVTYSCFFYTDSMAMPLVMASAYCYLKYTKVQKISLLILSSAFVGLAYKMKGSSLVLLIAIIMDMISSRLKIRDFMAVTLPCIISVKAVSESALKILHISHETLKQKSFPFIHWIMMSADGRGGYNREDFLYTKSFIGTAKKSADFDRLCEKLNIQGFGGFIHHLAEKITYTWENTTFMASYYNPFFSSKVFYVISFFSHFTILFSILIGIKKSTDKTFLFRLCLFGMIIFLLIWETRCRYLVSFFPLFMLI